MEPLSYPWLHKTLAMLSNLQEDQRLPHALVLSGPEGIGKSALMHCLAQQLLAVDAKNAQLFASPDGHPDLLWLKPEGKAELIKIDQIRAIHAFLSNTAQQGGMRVVVLEQAERMNLASANALLKTLEEPGANTLIGLLTDAPQQLLPTIRSRCQLWPLSCNLSEASEWLSAQGVPAEFGQSVWRLCQGAPLAIAGLYNSEAWKLRQEWVLSVLGAFDPLQLAEAYQAQPLLQMVDWQITLVNDLLRCHQQADSELLHAFCRPQLLACAKRCTVHKLTTYLDQCYQLKRYLQGRYYLNPLLTLEDMLIAWFR